MPSKVSGAEALARLQGEVEADSCLMCSVLSTSPWVLTETESCKVVLSKYPRKWGHGLVILKSHCESFSELSAETWLEAQALAHQLAIALETELDPVRVVVASVGTARHDLPMTSPHLHLHVIPLDNENEKPSEIFTWKHGIYEAEDHEFEALINKLSSHFA